MEIKEKKLVKEYFKFISGFLIIMILAGTGYFIFQSYFNKENYAEIKENKISGRIVDIFSSSKNDFKPVLEIDLNKQNQASKNIGGEEQEISQQFDIQQEQERQKEQTKHQEQIQRATIQQATSSLQQTANFKQCAFQTEQSSSRQKFIINEIAWMGGSSDFGLTATDEWMELKNISGAEVDVDNWQLIDKAEQIKINFSSLNNTKIKAGGFILLERTDDDSVPNISADLIYSNTLNNTDEGLRLFDSQCNLVDEVLATPDWPAGDNAQKRTMERSPDLLWHTYSGTAQNSIFGTPKKENSAPVAIPLNNESASSSGVSTNNQQQTTAATPTSSSAKILINEIQITAGTGKTENDFIELYNPNNFQVNLNGYRLIKRTKTGTSDTSIKSWTSDAYIPANEYYLWANSGYTDVSAAPDVTTTATISNDNGVAIRFGSEDTGVIIDSVAWGEAQNNFIEGSVFPTNPTANQSIQRKFQNNTFIDIDNNANDFEIQTCPSPKAPSKNCQQANQAPGAFFVYTPQNPNVGDLINFDAASSTDSDGQIISYQWDFGDNATSIISTATTTHAYSQAGNYSASLIIFDNQNVSSAAASTTISVSASGSASGVNHLVISEILFNPQGPDEGKEFIELYNPAGGDFDIKNWSLKILKNNVNSAETLAKLGSKTEDITLIKSKSFLLIGFNSYISTGAFADIIRSTTLPNSTSTIYLTDNNDAEIDQINYSNILENIGIVEGQSFERKAWQNNSCVSAQNEGEFLGNACDTDSQANFEIRNTPNPQNFQSPPEQ